MTINRFVIGGQAYYYANKQPINRETLEAIGKEFFTAENWSRITEMLMTDGYADCTITSWDKPQEDILATAQKKIAALEKRVAQLTIENIYLTA